MTIVYTWGTIIDDPEITRHANCTGEAASNGSLKAEANLEKRSSDLSEKESVLAVRSVSAGIWRGYFNLNDDILEES